MVEGIRLCLADGHSGTRYPCALCNGATEKDIPYGIYLMDEQDARVCAECATKVDPFIVEALNVLNAVPWTVGGGYPASLHALDAACEQLLREPGKWSDEDVPM